MVWGGISAHHRTLLVTIQGNLTGQRYSQEILCAHVVPHMARHGGIFMQDNARPHTAMVAQNVLNINRINVLNWPSRSPDLNPIEHRWDAIDRQVRARPRPPQNRQKLEVALQQEWQRIPRITVTNLIQSMHRRCRAVVQAQRGHIRYYY